MSKEAMAVNSVVKSSEVAATYKVILLGESTVGKTSLLSKFASGRFQYSLTATVGIDYRSRVIMVDDLPVQLKIWDTAGQERFETITMQYLRGAEGIVIVFDLTRQESVKKAEFWLQSITSVMEDEVPIVIVGNKSDLMAKRCVNLEIKDKDKVELCNKQFFYFETSALTGENVEEMFNRVGQLVAYSNGLYNPQRRGAILAHNLGLDRTNSRIHSYTETDSVDYQQDKSFRLSDNHKKEKSCTCR